VDDSAERKYKAVTGALGEALRRSMTFDEDGDRVFQMLEGGCPFWEDSGLCEIHRKLGEEMLCQTCKQFPRTVQDYGSFAEYGLSMACPEAARLILSQPEQPKMYLHTVEVLENVKDAFGEERDEDFACPPEVFVFLRGVREEMEKLLWNEHFTTEEILIHWLLYAAQVQESLDVDAFAIVPLYWPETCEEPLRPDTQKRFLAVYREMEVLTDTWNGYLAEWEQEVDAAEYAEFRHAALAFETEYRQMLQEGLMRYWMRISVDGDAISKIKWLAAQWLVVRRMQFFQWRRSHTLSFPQRIRVVQLYCKEVAHDCVNEDLLWDAFDKQDCFSLEQMIALLRIG
jgi:lysine-N-methylase